MAANCLIIMLTEPKDNANADLVAHLKPN